MRVFKFGGASVKDANAVRNVASILERFQQYDEPLIVVVSAMGKTTNALEGVMEHYANGNQEMLEETVQGLAAFHQGIITDLFEEKTPEVLAEVSFLFNALIDDCRTPLSKNFNFHYDQIISLGEVVSTKIITAFLTKTGVKAEWLDARKLVRTDDRWREGRVDWDTTGQLITQQLDESFNTKGKRVVVTQGFLGHTAQGDTTTLGREGSDFTASIFAYVTNAESVTIWKDVPGMLNADPKYFDNTVLLEKISFKEAIELAYFGASVIHPKTIQPLKRKNIPLYIKSFVHPEKPGSIIQESLAYDDHVPSFIFKLNQLLISLTPKDFSFIIEENLAHIFNYLNDESIRINLMQNSAVSFSFVVDAGKIDLEKFIHYFQDEYILKYNDKLELVTIRHYDDPTIKRVTTGKKIILEQKSRQTARLVISD